MRSLATMLLATAGLAVMSCRQVTGPEPPRILYGQEECARCRMIISDERFACALVIRHEDGHHESAAFDDINCLFEYPQSLGDAAVVARYVHDHDSLQWLNLSEACFVHSASLHTPMASGIAAFSTRAQADAMREARPDSELLDVAAVSVRYAPPQTVERSTER